MKRRTHMLHMLMLLFALFIPLIALADDEILISSDTDWSTFADNIHNGITYAGKTIRLTNDITVSTMADGSFQGTLIGSGHTITVNLSGSGDYTALFKEIKNAIIQSIKVEGSVTTSGHRPATFASFVSGISTIKNCWSAAAISSTITNNWVDGGAFIARVNSGAILNLQDCAFTGTITYYNKANEGGGMVGWTQGGAQANLTRCLFAPSVFTMGMTTDTSHLFVTGAVRGNLTDCYYNAIAKVSILDKEGTDASNMSTFELVSALNHNAEVWQIDGGGNIFPIMVLDSHNLQFATVSGIAPRNIYTGSAISITPVVTAADGTVLTLDADYKAALGTNNVATFPFSVTDKGNYALTLTGFAPYSETQTFNFVVFEQPEGLSFDDDYSEGMDAFYYVNMPRTGTKEINIPNGFTSSFTVYDDGGKNDNYSRNCSGNLVLIAPEDHHLRLSGKVLMYAGKSGKIFYEDNFTIYDSNGTTKLFNLKDSQNANAEQSFDVTSNGRSVRLYLESDNGSEKSGVNLTVEIIKNYHSHNVSVNSATGGSVSASPTSDIYNQPITLNVEPESGYLLSGLSVTDANNNKLPVMWDGAFYNTATFRMPNSEVTVTPTFTSNLTTDGGLFVNMSSTGTQTLDIPTGVQSFKVYDDGGKDFDYSKYFNATLVLTAPEGKVIQLSGNIMADLDESLTVYDGNSYNSTKLLDAMHSISSGTPTDIPVVVSSGRSMTLDFHTEYVAYGAGLDLTVKLIETNQSFDISISNPASGGSVSASPTSTAGQIVTLTASPASGYLLNDISVTDANNNHVALNWDVWTNTATFRMPGSNVTVTPTFTNSTSAASGLFVNMPATDSKRVIIPNGIQSFKVYDDGGKDGDYSVNCKGTLVLTAPTGHVLQLTGSIITNIYDKLDVYDGINDQASILLDDASSPDDGIPTDIPVVVSSNRSLTLYFKTGDSYKGLNLTVMVVNTNTSYDVTIGASSPHSGGRAQASPYSAKANQNVTLTAWPSAGYLSSGFIVTGTDNGRVKVNWDGPFYNTATFGMPGSNVTVTPTFTNNLTAEGGLYINLPTTGNKTLNIPTGVQSFKVYDDGGKDGYYSQNCNGSLTLCAPEGYYLQLSGSINSKKIYQGILLMDYLDVFDNSQASGTQLLKELNGNWENIPIVISSGRYMTIRFTTNDSYLLDGLDLTVDLIEANQSFDISVNNTASGGTIAADLASAKVNQIVTITASPDDGNLLSGISVIDDGNNSVQTNWKGPFFNTATFRMPPGKVTITPTFTNNLTAASGLYVNLPVKGYYIATIPEGVQSFKVYDDGGRLGNYSDNCNGSVVLCAPEGCYLQLSGTMKAVAYDPAINCLDYLAVFENSAYINLIDKMGSTYSGEQVDVPTVESSGRYMTINFHSDNFGNYSGLDLTVTVKYAPVTITFAKEGYSTYYNSKQDAVLPAGMKAYIVTASENGTTLTYETIADGDTWDRTVPAGTAVMLQTAASTTTQDIEVPLASPTAAAITQTNLLQGSDVNTTTKGEGKHYKLSYGASNGANANTLGWY